MIDPQTELGGTIVRHFDVVQAGRHVFADGPYTYYMLVIRGREEIRVADLRAFSVFILSAGSGTLIRVTGTSESLAAGDAVQVEAASLSVVVDGDSRILVAGTREASGRSSGVTVTPAPKVYRVTKPWGHELWINGQHPGYALKEIFIKKGTKTSLQYHRQKSETNVLFEGHVRLHYKKDAHIANDEVGPAHIGTFDLAPVSTVDVTPDIIHRLEAITDVLLYEVSTPHLDDVVRVQDDARRHDGRINAEHKA